MADNNEVWVVFRGKLVSDPSVPIENFEELESLDEVVEVVKAEKISKTHIKLKENPLFHPNVSYGDIMKVKPCDKSLSDKVTILEFSGLEHSIEDSIEEVDNEADDVDEEDVKDFGSANVGLSPDLVNLMKSYDSKMRPIINDKFEQGLVFEPTKLVSHGSYKINIAYEAGGDDFDKMKNHFKKRNVHFQKSSAMSLGSVAFGLDTKFKKAVECLESAPWVKACYLAFSPNDFPQIEFSPDLIPKNDEE
jgi:hypothetical protein